MAKTYLNEAKCLLHTRAVPVVQQNGAIGNFVVSICWIAIAYVETGSRDWLQSSESDQAWIYQGPSF